MKTNFEYLSLLPALIAGLCLVTAGRTTAQTVIAINADGANPNAGLVLSNNTLYGTAAAGGGFGHGTVFAINTDGSGFTNLHSFTGSNDGGNPWDGLIVSGNTLYGTAYGGGNSGNGTVFAVNTDGSGFTNMHSFTYSSDGAGPIGGLILTNYTLYGTTDLGGSSGNGTVFSLSFLPQLTIIPSGKNILLTWPTNTVGFTLQSTTNLGSAAVWSTSSPKPFVIGGQNVIINPLSGPQKFYRLSQ